MLPLKPFSFLKQVQLIFYVKSASNFFSFSPVGMSLILHPLFFSISKCAPVSRTMRIEYETSLNKMRSVNYGQQTLSHMDSCQVMKCFILRLIFQFVDWKNLCEKLQVWVDGYDSFANFSFISFYDSFDLLYASFICYDFVQNLQLQHQVITRARMRYSTVLQNLQGLVNKNEETINEMTDMICKLSNDRDGSCRAHGAATEYSHNMNKKYERIIYDKKELITKDVIPCI